MKPHWLLMMAAALLIGADAPKGDSKTDAPQKQDLAKMQGKWVAATGEHAGEKIPDEDLKTIRFNVTDDHYAFTITGEKEKGTLSLDSSKKPREIDIHITEGTQAGQLQRGIYEFDGGRFKLCFAGAGHDRPTDFNTKPTEKSPQGFGLFVFERPKQD